MKVSPEQIEKMYPYEGGDFEEMLCRSEEGGNSSLIKTGRIIRISDDSVMVDVQEKNEGRMDIGEIRDEDGNLLFKEGDDILVHISKRHGLRVSHKRALLIERIREEIKSFGDDYKDKIVEGVIVKRDKRLFVVRSAHGTEYIMLKRDGALRDDMKCEGKHIKACVVGVDLEGGRINISRKIYLDRHAVMQKEHARKLVESGLAYQGTVKNIQQFGIFVEVGCVEGLVHVKELSHKGHVNPFEAYKIGDVVQVKPLSFDEEKGKLSFSIRSLLEDPWKEISSEIKVGYVIRVTVSNVESYGAFVDLGNDIEGFLHISEMSWEKNIKDPSIYVKVGDEIDVEVIEIDTENKKLRVSLRKLQDRPFDAFAKASKVGDVVKGKVATITSFGMFVNLGSVDGLVHNEDAFWDRSKKCAGVFHEGDEVEVKIQKIDRVGEKISLSIKDLERSPVDKFSEKYRIDDTVSGKVVSIKNFGIFLKVDDEEVEAIVRNDDLGDLNKDDIKVGDSIEGALSQIDKKANKIRVSVRRLQKKKEREELNKFNSDEKMVLGDVLGDLKEKLQRQEGLSRADSKGNASEAGERSQDKG